MGRSLIKKMKTYTLTKKDAAALVASVDNWGNASCTFNWYDENGNP